MSHSYVQLLGTDIPQGCGGCCFYGAVEHAALRAGEREAMPGSACGSDGYLLFNCPEGTQRFSSEANIKLTKIKGFFFTRWGSRTSSQGSCTTSKESARAAASHRTAAAAAAANTSAVSAVMGLPGLLFTINDAGVEQANFFGPSDTPSEVRRDSDGNAGVGGCNDDDDDASVDEYSGKACGGLRLFLCALRRHYFTYRRMSFRLLVPTGKQAAPCTASATAAGCTAQEHGTPTSPRPRDELYPLPCANATLQTTSQLPFIVATILINAQTLLVAFRVSSPSPSRTVAATVPETKMVDNSAGDVFGYAVVTTTGPRFDPQRARALGVAPGPAYGVLKQGHDVGLGEEATGRVVRAQDVMQDTLGNHYLFVSLILDGDAVADVRAAVERLLGTSEVHDGEGALQHILRTEQPQLWFVGATADSTPRPAQREARQVVVHQVVHLQPAHYFANALHEGRQVAVAEQYTTAADAGEAGNRQARAVYTAYLHEVFSQVSSTVVLTMTPTMFLRATAEDDTADTSMHALLWRQRRQMPRGAATDGDDTGLVTRHLFTSLVVQHFSAFPTALTHRYHLHRIAPTLFPVTKPVMGGTVGELWPYAFKFRCIPDCATATWPAVCHDTPPPRLAGRWGAVGGATSVLRYPDMASACALLSPQFVRQLTADCIDVHADVEYDAGHNAESALVFLGTGSAVPGKYRNVSGTCLELRVPAYCVGRSYDQTRPTSRAVVVLDFGEGSLGQLAALAAATHPAKRDDDDVSLDDCDMMADAQHRLRDDPDAQFGYSAALRAYILDIVLVFISHGHADHHLGLCSLLTLRHECMRYEAAPGGALEPLLVLCPREVLEFVRDTWGATAPYADWLWTECTFEVIDTAPCTSVTTASGKNAENTAPDEIAELPVLQTCLSRWNRTIATATTAHASGDGTLDVDEETWAAAVCAADHPAGAHALFLRFPSALVTARDKGAATLTRSVPTRTLFFSGDTRPSEALIRRCKHFCAATPLFLCLHEATFGPGYEIEADRKKHSTLPEALEVGRRMGAQYIVLNHFSQRYPKLPGLAAEQLGGSEVDLQCKRRGGTRKGAPVAEQLDHACTASDRDGTPRASGEGYNMCFAFDLMRLDFAELAKGTPCALTPTFVRLLEEYESWGTGTTKRLRQGH